MHVHAPRADASYVAIPPLADATAIAQRNRECLAAARIDLQGCDLSSIRAWARREAIGAARTYTAGLLAGELPGRPADSKHAQGLSVPGDGGLSGGATTDATEAALFVGGHQPTLFHPGVWVKNFVVGRLAHNERGIGLNLVVDTDTLSGTTVRVPTGRRSAPGIAAILFDEPRPRQPWEEARVVDRSLFTSFPDRVLAALGESAAQPLVDEFWPAAVRRLAHSNSLAECLTAARSAWERGWGLANLELPVSRLCTLEPFLWFAAHLLAHLPRFHAVYNETLREYRQVNRVRSRTHPVPDLREQDGWLEAPFRVWRAGDEVRRPVFARQEGGELRLSDGASVFATLPLTPGKDACCAVRELQLLAPRGIRFRTRALSTTLFARLCFADLFVHGIGGAKYDQMTDRIVARFFGLAAPEFLTLSATLRLVEEGLPVERTDELRLTRQLRELDYHPDRHVSAATGPAVDSLIAEKRRLILEQHAARGRVPPGAGAPVPLGAGGYVRFRRFQEINRLLADFTRDERRRIEDELARTRRQLAANAVLHDREYAFCLYPAEKLKRFMDHVCDATNA